jgi:hypothetical protein
MKARRYGVIFLGVLLLLWGSSRHEASAEDVVGEDGIVATYQVALAGISLGEFNLTAAFSGSAYELRAKGKFSLLAGMIYRASGSTKSTGELTKAGPKPSKFVVSYRGGKKKEQREMRFADGAVSEVSITPRKKPNPRNVPVTGEQLVNVLDPLTAAFLSAHSDGPPGDLNVCHRTVPVFDGKQRYDILLSPKRTETLESEAPSELSSLAAVCQVKFLPIGGYRPDNPGIKFLTQTDEIEVWLVSLPPTALYVPYQIFVPTALGTGSVTLTKLKMNFARRASIR